MIMPQSQRGAGPMLWMAVATGMLTAAVAGVSRLVIAPAPPLQVFAELPAFALIDQDGRSFSLEDLRGRVTVASFIFTRCAGQCPLMTAEMARLAREFAPDGAQKREGDAAIQLVSFSVDPQWDTPERLAAYANAQGPKESERSNERSASWRFVTGEPAEIDRLCRDGFKLALSQDGGTAEEPIAHSTRLVLIDRAAKIRGDYDTAEAGELARLRRELRQLVRSGA